MSDLADSLAWYLKQNPKTKHLAKNVKGGLELLFYYTRCWDAIEAVPKPRGCELEPLSLSTTRIKDAKVLKHIFEEILPKALKNLK